MAFSFNFEKKDWRVSNGSLVSNKMLNSLFPIPKIRRFPNDIIWSCDINVYIKINLTVHINILIISSTCQMPNDFWQFVIFVYQVLVMIVLLDKFLDETGIAFT